MKKAFMLVLCGVSGCAVLAGALAFSGPIRFNNLQVRANADPSQGNYSITFDGESSIEEHNDDGHYAICETTENGNKLGVVGWGKWYPRLSFHGTNFLELQLHNDSCALWNNGADDFDHITGYKISFSGGPLFFRTGGGHEGGSSVTSGVTYDVSLTPDDYPVFVADEHGEDIVTISSLTIWYSC